MAKKAPLITVTCVLFLLLVLVGLAPTIQSAPPAQEDDPRRSFEEFPEDLPHLESDPGQPKSNEDRSVPDLGLWSKLVFQSYRDLNDWDIYVASGDGSGQVPVTSHYRSDIHPRLNRGCTRIAFASNRDDQYEIYTMNIDGSDVNRLTVSPQSDGLPAWSPDGTRIAFLSYRDGQAEIYVMNADGSGQTRLTAHEEYDGEPAWSPDGTQIAFTSKRTGGYRIWVMNADGSGKAQLSNQPYSENPAWSPDGSQIAYDSDGDGDGWQELWLMNADGTGQHLVRYAGMQSDIWVRSWSPDGRYVAFTNISFIEYQGNWYWTEAYLDAWDSTSGSVVRLSANGTDWHPDWQTADNTPPTSRIDPLPAVSPSPIVVSWTGSDVGPAGIMNYDVQVKEGSEGTWVDWQSSASNTSAPYPGLGDHTYYFRCRARDSAGNVEPWPLDYQAVTTVEACPPQTAVDPLPAFSRGDITVAWGGWDPGGSSIETYDVQTRDAETGDWTDWHMETPNTSATFSGTPGHTYYFRARARDAAQNLEDWPAGDGDTHTTFYTWRLSGTARDNAGTPVAGAIVTTTPEALAVIPSDTNGNYLAFTADAADAYSTAWGKSGYGALPATLVDASQDTIFDVILPPIDNVLLNWGFESGSMEPDWLISGAVSPKVTSTVQHTGDYAAMIGLPSSGFTPGLSISDSATFTQEPQLSVDAERVLHVVWNQGYHVHYARRESTGTWSTPQDISGAWGGCDPQLAVDDGGAVHVVWYGNDPDDIYYTRRASDGSWVPPYNISSSSVLSRKPKLAVAPDGSVNVVWREGSGVIMYARRESDGSWSTSLDISAYVDSNDVPQIAVSQSGSVHVVWGNFTGTGNSVWYARRAPDNTWSNPYRISEKYTSAGNPRLAAEGSDTVHAIWEQEGNIYYARRSEDGTWSEPQQISDSDAARLPRIALQKNGVVHVVWDQSSEIDYARRECDGAWSLPVKLSDHLGGVAEQQLAVDQDGVVHVVWNDNYLHIGRGSIFYTRAEAEGSWSHPRMISDPSDNKSPRLAVDVNGRAHVVWESLSSQIIYAETHLIEQDSDSSIAQGAVVPVPEAAPTLSFLYSVDQAAPTGGARFGVLVDDGIISSPVFTTSTITCDWEHGSVDLTAWAGQTVTLTFSLSLTADYGPAWVYLDEVTLGSAYADPWVRKEGLVPTATRGRQATFAIAYGNRGGAPADSVQITDQLPLELGFVAANPPPIATLPSLVWDAGDLPAKSGSFTIVVTTTVSHTVPVLSYLTNTVSIETVSPELETLNNDAQTQVVVLGEIYLPLVMRYH